MKKHFSFVLFSLMVTLFYVSNVCVASAALRNLLSEFRSAVSSNNIEKVQALLKEGVDINDVAKFVIVNSPAKSNGSFYVSLIETVAKVKGGKKALQNNFPPDDDGNFYRKFNDIPNAVLKALLEAGIDPDAQITSGFFYSILDMFWNNGRFIFQTLSKEYTQSHTASQVIERVKILVDNGAKTDFWFGFDTRSAGQYFVENSWEDLVKALTSSEAVKEKYTSYFTKVINILKDAGADMTKAKEFLKDKRDDYRNYPDVIAYINQLDEIITGSFWQNWKWWIIIGFIALVAVFGSKG